MSLVTALRVSGLTFEVTLFRPCGAVSKVSIASRGPLRAAGTVFLDDHAVVHVAAETASLWAPRPSVEREGSPDCGSRPAEPLPLLATK